MRFLAVLLIVILIGCGATPSTDHPNGGASTNDSNDQQCESYFAQCDGCAGGVLLEFDINEIGHPENIKVLASCPPGKYDQEALEAVPGWEYKESDRGRKNVRTSLRYMHDEK